MAFAIQLFLLIAITYNANAGILTDHHNADSYVSSAFNAPSASFGAPSTSYGPPAHVEDLSAIDGSPLADAVNSGPILDTGLTLSNGVGISGHAFAGNLGADASALGPISSGPAFVPGNIDGAPLASGPGLETGGAILDTGLATGPANGAIGEPRVIGTTVTVSRPDSSASRYELQSVVQNVVRRVPVEVTRHVKVAVPHAVPVPVRQEVKVPVPQPYPVHVDVVKHVPYPVFKTEHVEVERPVPVEVVKHVPFEIIKKVHIPVERPFEVIKKVHVPIEKHVEVPVPVWKPYPVHIIKHVTHYKKKSCCW